MTPTGEVSAAIIAGGQGTRMGGRIKALIEVDGETILARQLRLLREVVGGEIIISANDPLPFAGCAHRVIADEVRDSGPLAGLAACRAAITSPWLLCIASDMPSISAAVLAAIIAARDSSVDAVIPVIDGRPEPLCALYGPRCLEVFRERLTSGRRSLRGLVDCDDLVVRTLTEADIRDVDPTFSSFTNLNLPDDLG